ncbi:hypothetical protein [Novosphingobium lentum]|uniref:hypothetical protein n=1 Tax=Novosphingobium lentum TaxID=145287 RepID=UPI00082B2BF4|nr:hypothetical protein [Novosphingobium lentum]
MFHFRDFRSASPPPGVPDDDSSGDNASENPGPSGNPAVAAPGTAASDAARGPMRAPKGLVIGLGLGCLVWLAIAIVAFTAF